MIGWTSQNNRLIQTYQFKDFKTAFAFMQEVAIYAEEINHHPYWTNCYNVVRFELNTHSTGGTVTDLDILLSKTIDQLYSKYSNE
jgi:4a-hydroxytetrahydrobiopterin dehydratase